jgi:exonuclease VII large subunit
MYTLYEQHSIEKKLSNQLQLIEQLKEQFQRSIAFVFSQKEEQLQTMQQKFPQAIKNALQTKQNQITMLQNAFEASNPKQKSKQGFAQIVQDGKIIDIAQLHVEDTFEAQTSDIILKAKVLDKRKIV